MNNYVCMRRDFILVYIYTSHISLKSIWCQFSIICITSFQLFGCSALLRWCHSLPDRDCQSCQKQWQSSCYSLLCCLTVHIGYDTRLLFKNLHFSFFRHVFICTEYLSGVVAFDFKALSFSHGDHTPSIKWEAAGIEKVKENRIENS